MTVVSEIVTDGFRESNLIAVGAEPKEREQTEGLRLLRRLVDGVFGSDTGELLRNWPLGNFGRAVMSTENLTPQQLAYPPQNCRFIAVNDLAMTVYLPVAPSPGSRFQIVDPFSRLSAFPLTISGNGRAVEGAPQILVNTDGTNITWFYRDDIASWVRITEIQLAGQMPFPSEYDDYFVTKLAMRINPRYGKDLSELTIARLKEQRQELMARYTQDGVLAINPEVSFSSKQSFENWANVWLNGVDTASWARGGWFGGWR